MVSPDLPPAKIDENPHLCACGCGQPIPRYYAPFVKYIKGHNPEKKSPKTGEQELRPTPPERNPGSFRLSKRAAKKPNWDRMFRGLDKFTAKRGVPVGTWKLDKDEKRDIDEAWGELIESAEQAAWIAKLLNSLGVLLFLLNLFMIFAPRMMTTWEYMIKGEQDGRTDPNRGKVGSSDSGTESGRGELHAANDVPWRGFNGRPETIAAAGEEYDEAGVDQDYAAGYAINPPD